MIIIKKQARAGLAPVVQTVDNAIHWMNRYQMDSAVRFVNGCVIRPLNNYALNFFFRPYFYYCLRSVHYCEDRFQIHFLNRSSYTSFS